MQRDPRGAQCVGEAAGVAHHRLGGRVGADQRQHPVAGRPRAGDGLRAHVAGDVGIHPLCDATQRHLAQRREIAFPEEPIHRALRHVGTIDVALLQPLAQLVGRQVDQLDLVGHFQHAVGQRLAHPHAGDARHRIVQAFQMLDVQRCPDVDAGFERSRPRPPTACGGGCRARWCGRVRPPAAARDGGRARRRGRTPRCIWPR